MILFVAVDPGTSGCGFGSSYPQLARVWVVSLLALDLMNARRAGCGTNCSDSVAFERRGTRWKLRTMGLWNGMAACSTPPRREMSHAGLVCSGGVFCGIKWPGKTSRRPSSRLWNRPLGRGRVPALAGILWPFGGLERAMWQIEPKSPEERKSVQIEGGSSVSQGIAPGSTSDA